MPADGLPPLIRTTFTSFADPAVAKEAGKTEPPGRHSALRTERRGDPPINTPAPEESTNGAATNDAESRERAPRGPGAASG